MTLVKDIQTDFSAGGFPKFARDEIPTNGLEDVVNAIITDDGLLDGRGGSTQKSVGTGGSTKFMWDGYLAPGLRTLLATPSDFFALNADDTAVTNIGGAGLSAPGKAASAGGMLFLPGGAIWGGSRLTTTLSITAEVFVGQKDSPTITTSNPPTTPWTSTYIQPGTLVRAKTGLGDNRYYVVKSLDSDHQVTLYTPYLGPSFVDFIDFEFVQIGQLTGGFDTGIYFAVANKLVAVKDDVAFMSEIGAPTSFSDTEFHKLPGGSSGLGGEALRDIGIIFTTAGIWAISNIALDLTDEFGNPQQRLEELNRDIVLWSWPGVAHWGNSLIVPATNGVWLFDGVNASRITGGMEFLYRSYVAAGYQAGNATVFNNHYLLPILDGSGAPVDLLVCRLTATRRGRGDVAFGWSRFAGAGASMISLSTRIPTSAARQQTLLGAHSAGAVYNLAYWTPATVTDVGGASVTCTLVTREDTDDTRPLTKKVRIRYELTDPAAANPTIAAEWAHADGAYTALTGAGAETTEPTDYTWLVRKTGPRFRLTTSGQTSKFRLHSITRFLRPTTRA